VIKLVRRDGKFQIRFIAIYPIFTHKVIQIEKKENKKCSICWGNL